MNRLRGWQGLTLVALLLLIGGAVFASAMMHPARRWSDAQTWNGHMPGVGEAVHIARGQTVLLDTQTPALGVVTVDGRLIVADRDVRLEAKSIVVHGVLEVGSSSHRFAHRAQIVLDGGAPELGALTIPNGGRVELWGARRMAWTHLSSTARAGDVELVLESPPDWQAGDRIAIAPSGFNANEAEERTITSIDGVRVRVDTPLKYRHWGTVTDGVDERAEVGLLSHTVTIESEVAASARGLGGEVIVTNGGTLHASDTTFEGLGQKGRLGRYPVHFHLVGDASGSFVEESSIVHSNNRCLTVHGTSGVVVRDNVAFDTIGHCYFLEDGIESGNTFEGNLGILTRAATTGNAILESDVMPATYWITNPANVVRNNVAAGSQGMGFWYNLSPHPTGPSTNSAIWPRRTSLGEFSGDVSHSNEMNGLFVDIQRNPPGVTEAPNYAPPTLATFNTFTSYKNRRRGVWLRGTKLRLTNATIADNSIGVTFAGADALLLDSLVVGETENLTGPPKPFEANFPVRGFEFYDGQVGVERTHFVNFASNAIRPASALSELQFSPFFSDPSNYASALTFTNAQPVFFEKHIGAKDRLGADGYRGSVFHDIDGSVTGHANSSVVLDTPLLADSDCLKRAQWNALICPSSYGSLFIIGVDAGHRSPGPVQVARTDRGAYLTLYGNPQPGKDAIFQTSVRGNRAYSVTFAHGFPQHVVIGLHDLPEGQGITLTFPQASPSAIVRDHRDPVGAMISHRQNNALVVNLEQMNGDGLRGEVLDICAADPCG